MKKIAYTIVLVLLYSHLSHAQRLCGYQLQVDALSKTIPGFAERLETERQMLQTISDNYYSEINNVAYKTTAVAAIPVIFHIVLDSARFNELGGVAGIRKRCDSQIAVLNRDYNRENPDSIKIPLGWKPTYKSAGIRFGLAHTAPDGTSTPGYDIRISTKNFVRGSSSDYGDVKDAATGGISTWDPEKYLNVWCMYFSDYPTLLGITTPYSFTSGTGGLPANRRGICITYNALGKRTSPSESYADGGKYDRGRTLTHECGHYFALRHTWGDDPSGYCPWTSGGGADDGITDTPPESNPSYGSPAYSIPNGTLYDGCKFNGATLAQPIGIPCLNFMNYTIDSAMYMFSAGQVGVMASKVLVPSGESYPLTQNPDLLNYPTTVKDIASKVSLFIYPNPTKGRINIDYDRASDVLNEVCIINTLGQVVYKTNNNPVPANYSINLEEMGSGVYYVSCNFASGHIIQKIVLL